MIDRRPMTVIEPTCSCSSTIATSAGAAILIVASRPGVDPSTRRVVTEPSSKKTSERAFWSSATEALLIDIATVITISVKKLAVAASARSHSGMARRMTRTTHVALAMTASTSMPATDVRSAIHCAVSRGSTRNRSIRLSRIGDTIHQTTTSVLTAAAIAPV